MSKFFLFALAVLITLPSCRKVYDFIHDNPDARDTLCRITRLTFSAYDPSIPQGNILQLGVTYNAKGNPLSLTEINPGKPIYTTELYFRYDRFDRLTDFMYTVAGGPFYDSTRPGDPLLWHKYSYPRPDIIVDTFIEYLTAPLNGPPPIAQPGATIFLYKFNAAGKMIASATTTNLPNQPPPVFNLIAYDARGNRDLSVYTNIVYDNSINPYRTNKVWQLVFGDYSRNSPIFTTSDATPTNQYGLPTRLPYITTADVRNFDWYSYYVPYYYIEYACSAPKGPINY